MFWGCLSTDMLKDNSNLLLESNQRILLNTKLRNLVLAMKIIENQQRCFLVNKGRFLIDFKQVMQNKQVIFRPFIKINRTYIYKELVRSNIINSKKVPCCKVSISSNSDSNILLYYNRLGFRLLNYYRCADDFDKIKNIIN